MQEKRDLCKKTIWCWKRERGWQWMRQTDVDVVKARSFWSSSWKIGPDKMSSIQKLGLSSWGKNYRRFQHISDQSCCNIRGGGLQWPPFNHHFCSGFSLKKVLSFCSLFSSWEGEKGHILRLLGRKLCSTIVELFFCLKGM